MNNFLQNTSCGCFCLSTHLCSKIKFKEYYIRKFSRQVLQYSNAIIYKRPCLKVVFQVSTDQKVEGNIFIFAPKFPECMPIKERSIEHFGM